MYSIKTYNAATGNWIAILKDNGNGTQSSIPSNPANTDYQAYLAWLEEGNTPEPADEV